MNMNNLNEIEHELGQATEPGQIDKLVKALSGVRSLGNLNLKDYLDHQLHQQLLKILLSYVDLESCSLFLLQDNVLRCAAATSWAEQTSQAVLQFPKQRSSFKLGEGILGLAARDRTLIHCSDISVNPDFIQTGEKNTKKGSLISVALIASGELLGVLNISHPQKDFFHSWHEKIMATYANLIAQILQNHKLIHSMEAEIYERTRELKLALKESNDLRKRYQELSFVDYLTELHNRRYFFPEFSSTIASAHRTRQNVTLLILDLDLFKSINDNYGHELGDAVLIGVSQLLKRQIRKSDILARLGGEEFAIALRGTDLEAAKHFANRLRIMIAELKWSFQNETIQITASIGLSSLDNYDTESDEMVRIMMSEADMALYACKDNGRDQIRAYEDLESAGGSRSIN